MADEAPGRLGLGGWAPDPARGAYSAPPDPLAGLQGPTSKGGEGKGDRMRGEGMEKNGGQREERGEGREVRGEEGRRREGRGGGEGRPFW